jgi:Arc/MetJ-type ribon-helix-helix transcriptional regulator
LASGLTCRYAHGMTTEQVTVNLPTELLAAARQAVATGAAVSVSAFIVGALQAHVARTRGLAELERVFGGPPPPEVLDAVRRDLGLTRR